VAISLSRPASPSFVKHGSVLKHGSFLAIWQVQSKLGSLALLALLAVSPWSALVVSLLWTLAATFVYYTARHRGVPDFLAVSDSSCRAARTGQVLGGVWLVGLSAFAFANVLRPLLRSEPLCRRSRITRFGVLGVGLTLFGVTMNQHMLQVAGYRGPKLLAVSLAGAFLNVPYRIFCGALTLHVLLSLMSISITSRYI
jgi:hypothetical protein